MAKKIKPVYLCTEGHADMKDLLGGKGANLAEMTSLGVDVPAVFTVTTQVCRDYSAAIKDLDAKKADEVGIKFVKKNLADGVKRGITFIEKQMGRKFGDPKKPLLVSVRSGAPISMPGMMDTVLNLGMNDETQQGMAELTGDARMAADSHRRFLQMFGNVVLGIDGEEFEHVIDAVKAAEGARLDTDLCVEGLGKVIVGYRKLIKKHFKAGVPDDPWEQLYLAIKAVFESWNNDRAIAYRADEGIPDEMGTAVNVQAMVFGNMGETSGTGVVFTRNADTGARELKGSYLMNAQGEDVVAGIRNTHQIPKLKKDDAKSFKELNEICKKLEKHYRDAQDIEFTIEQGRLFILQTRNAKRTSKAAIRIAHDLCKEKLISKDEALTRIKPDDIVRMLFKQVKPSKSYDLLATGIAASPGVGRAEIVFSSQEAEKEIEKGREVILVRPLTSPDDTPIFKSVSGILTSQGGEVSHAAIIAKQRNKPCVVGCEALDIDVHAKTLTIGQRVFKKGDTITVDGNTGHVYAGDVEMEEPELDNYFHNIMKWADQRRKLKIYTNVDDGENAAHARSLGAEGIGLCRTEHMFQDPQRVKYVQDMILTELPKAKASLPVEEQEKLLRARREKILYEKILPMQQGDFEEIFRAMDGLPVVVRLLDPPLNEFLPNPHGLKEELMKLKARGKADTPGYQKKEAVYLKALAMEEENPMMGFRGCRLGIRFYEIYEMQVRAILQAAVKVREEGVKVKPEIMIPLIGHVNELKFVQGKLEGVAKQVLKEAGKKLNYMFGTMIEIPRAALTAGEIAEVAQFFSFGTNDLTQMTFGYSRDDAQGSFLMHYIEDGILEDDPFGTVDQIGVGRLMKLAVAEGREARPELKVGICGEHGGEPRSINFCHDLGLNYVSCSPLFIMRARLAAAQAEIRNPRG